MGVYLPKLDGVLSRVRYVISGLRMRVAAALAAKRGGWRHRMRKPRLVLRIAENCIPPEEPGKTCKELI